MAIQPHKGAFVDFSNRHKLPSKTHSHLRPLSSSSLRKSPPTCTISLANVTASPRIPDDTLVTCRDPILFPASFVPFPGLASDSNPTCGDQPNAGLPPSDQRRRPRARTSHVETPRRTKRPSCIIPSSPQRLPGASTPTKRTPRPCKRAAAELRFISLIERSISKNLRHQAWDLPLDANPFFDSDSRRSEDGADDELQAQDELLAGRLRRSLTVQGYRPSSPPRSMGISLQCRPPSVLLSGSTETIAIPQPTLPPMRFIPRSASSDGNSRTLPMSNLVATLILRHGNDRARSLNVMSSSDTGVANPNPKQPYLPRRSPLAACSE
ncbi:hypothetical protein B0H10DRAFT_2445652 [Mycena sp. CBHHK59/15]|nr:hypothetical protein B0H10DRAFT_2445652 [Mycena sp. CBHHK59/15]